MGEALKTEMVALVALSITAPLYGCEGESKKRLDKEYSNS